MLARHWLRQRTARQAAHDRLAARTDEEIQADAVRAAASRARRRDRLRKAKRTPPAAFAPHLQLSAAVAVADAVASGMQISWADLHDIAADRSTGSVSVCGHKLHADQADMVLDATGRLRWNGSVMCGSVWSCPKCSAIIAAVRCEEIKSAVKIVKKAGGVIVMETRTIPHAAGDALSLLLDRLAVARDYMRTSRPARVVVEMMMMKGYVGDIRGLEITAGLPNGWHPHEHAAMAFSRPISDADLVAITDARKELWLQACRVAGLPPPSATHGLSLVGGATADDQLAAYIAKYGKQPSKGAWGAEQELALSVRKKGKAARLHPFGLLRIMAAADRDAVMPASAVAWAERQWKEYEVAIRGQRQLVYSRRLVAWLEAQGWRTVTDEEAMKMAEQQEGDDLIGSLAAPVFHALASNRRVLPILAEAQAAVIAVAQAGRQDQIVAARQVLDRAATEGREVIRLRAFGASLGRKRDVVPEACSDPATGPPMAIRPDPGPPARTRFILSNLMTGHLSGHDDRWEQKAVG